MIALGINSGTSMDGISLAMVDINKNIKLLAYKTYKFPKMKLELTDISSIAKAHYWFGNVFANAACGFIKETRITPKVIGSHGQTIYHAPPCSMQIGEGALIACHTGITTVCDFRWQDLASGGEGAPLVPYLDYVLFKNLAPIATLNLGGIANITLLSRQFNKIQAFDTGPGNCIIDHLVTHYTKGKQRFDKNGLLAAKGQIDEKFLQQILANDYYKRKIPKSADKSAFDVKIKKVNLDHITTATFATVLVIKKAFDRFIDNDINQIIVSGGGVFNKTLMSLLNQLMYPVNVVSISKYGIHPLAKEPMLFALLAVKSLQGKPCNVPFATGAKSNVILGKIVRC